MPNAKNLVPDGSGGYTFANAKRFSDGSKANKKKQTDILNDEHWKRVGEATEYFNRVHKLYATDQGLSVEEFAKALYLELLNCKEFFPKDLGGPRKFDEYCKAAYDWFQANKDK